MKLNAYLNYNGDCEAAFAYYAQLLGGRVEGLMRYGDIEGCAEMAAGSLDKVMHSCLMLGDQALMGNDAIPAFPYEGVRGASVVVHIDDVAQAERVFAELEKGGTVKMPIQKTFWAERYGMLVDRYGTPWMINCAPAGCTNEPGADA